MAAVEPTAQQLFTCLENAEEHLPARWVERTERAQDAVIGAVTVGVQFAWLCAFGYAAYWFIFGY